MSDQIEELIREIVANHGIAVARDDPILVLQTINSRLLHDTAKAQQIQLDHFKEELEGISLRWGTDAREKAERILNASLAASKDVMGEMLQNVARAAAASVADEIGVSLKGISGHLHDARQITMLNIAASCITMLAAALTLWATFR